MAASLLWLCARPHGCDRSLPGGGVKKRRLMLPEPSWLRHRCEQADVSLELAANRRNIGSTPWQITALLRILPGPLWPGPLGNWSLEADLLRRYYEMPLDSLVVHIQDVFKLQEPVPAVLMRHANGHPRKIRASAAGGLLPLIVDTSDNAAIGTLVSSSATMTLRELCDGPWECPLDALTDIPSTVVTDPIARLAATGRWTDLVLLSRWVPMKQPWPLPGGPPAAWRQEHHGRHQPVASSSHDPQRILTLINNLRRWSGPILAAVQDDGEAAIGERAHLCSAIEWLEGLLCRTTTDAVAPRESKSILPNRNSNSYSSKTMVASHILSWKLCNHRTLREASAMGANVIFRGYFSTVADQLAAQEVPSTSLIQNRRICFDYALLKLHREDYGRPGFARYAWGDSSYQAGRDWFQCKSMLIANAHLVNVCASIDALIKHNKKVVLLDAETVARHNSTIEKNIHKHLKVPMAKGHGVSSAEHIASCFSQGAFFEAPDFSAYCTALDEHVCFTSDLGTDMGLRSFLVTCPSETLPPWLRPEPIVTLDVDAADVDGDLHVPDNPSPPASELRCLLPNALDVYGGCHITSNLGKDLSLHLEHWKQHNKELRYVEPLVTENHLRERFEEKCLNFPNAPALPKWGGGSLYEDRWLCVHAWCKRFLEETFWVFRGNFRADRFTAGMRKKSADDNADFSPARAEKLLNSGLFKSYTLLVVLLGSILGHLTAWIESCPCHENVVKECRTRSKRRQRFRREFRNVSTSQCPVCGCRAPELAARAVLDFLAKLFALAESELVRSFEGDMSESDRAVVLDDFNAGKSWIELGLRQKLDFWQRLPWLLCALGHWDAGKRAFYAQLALQAWETAEKAGFQLSDHHPISVLFLATSGALREHVITCAHSGVVHPRLAWHVCRLKLIPTAERTIEKEHAQLNLKVGKRNVASPYSSLAGRMPYLLDEIERDKAYYDRLLEAYEEAETPDQIARGLRLERHPVWLQCTAQGQRFHLHDKYRLLSKIVYRCDRSSLFASYAPQRGKHDRAVQRIANLKAARARADEAAAGREPISSSLVLRTAAVDHFKETLDHACLYSFSPGAGAAVDVCSLDACLGQPSYLRRVPCGGSASAVQLETDGGDALCTHGPTDETQETLFFRVVHRKPASMKTVRLPAASAGRIASDAMAITVHKAVDAPSGDPFVHTQPSIAGGCGVALFPDLVKFELGTLQNNLLEWTAAGPLQYHFGLLGICDCASEISTVNELVQNKAWPDGEEGVELHSSQDCIADLKHLGHIVRAPRGGYRLTEAGMRALRCARVASDPQPALRLRSHLPLKDRTAYELAMALQDAGFQWRQLPRNTSQREKLAYRVDDASSALEWYTASTHLSRPYLLCLLQAQTLRDSFGTESIPHWHGLGDKAYSRMLEGKPPSSPPRLAVLDDPDVDMLGIEDAPAAGPAVGIDGDIIEQSFEEMLAAIIEEEGIVFPPDPAESPPEAPAIPSEPTHEGLSQVHRDEQIHFDADMRVFCSSLRWGSGKFKWSAADASAPFGSVAAICACHKKNKRTLCVKEVGLRSRDMSHVESVLWALKHWLNQGPEYSRRRFHMLPRRLDLAAVPSPRVVEAQRIADNPPDNVLDDDELDALHGPAVAPVRGSAVASAATRPRPLPDAALDDVLALPAPVRGSAVASAATCPRPLPDAALDDDSGCHSGSTLDHLAPSSMHSGSTLDHLAPSSMSSDSESSD